jgi:hypothetical protein
VYIATTGHVAELSALATVVLANASARFESTILDEMWNLMAKATNTVDRMGAACTKIWHLSVLLGAYLCLFSPSAGPRDFNSYHLLFLIGMYGKTQQADAHISTSESLRLKKEELFERQRAAQVDPRTKKVLTTCP